MRRSQALASNRATIARRDRHWDVNDISRVQNVSAATLAADYEMTDLEQLGTYSQGALADMSTVRYEVTFTAPTGAHTRGRITWTAGARDQQ